MIQNAWKLLKESVGEFLKDDVMPRAASLAFYTALGLAPTILLFLSLTSFLGDEVRQGMISQIEEMAGPAESGEEAESKQAIKEVIASADKQDKSTSIIATVISVVTLLFSASGIFAQLQETLNKMWDVEPAKGSGIWGWISKRLLSMGMVLAMLFLLLVSLMVTAALSLVTSDNEGIGWAILNTAISLAVYWAGFALILKYLPDAKITWHDVAIGAGITAVLFAIGKFAIGMYIGNKSFGSEYGAAGSLIALLIWVYYSGIIFFFGAEVTQVYARLFGTGVVPEDNAQRKNEKMPALRYD